MTALPLDAGEGQPDETATARHGLRVARAALGTAEPCPDSCPICHSGWTYAGSAIGPCALCGQPCRSRDPDGRAVHPSCAAGEGEG